jgi:UDP-3-O-[3-hydroxymyristoyl] glucosamine N-acyltransferase
MRKRASRENAHIGPFVLSTSSHWPQHRASGSVSFIAARKSATIFAHAPAVVRESCRVGNRVILQNGVIIGGDGFGFAKQKDGTWYKMLQTGPAILEDDVEVQANSCVDRATIGETRVARGAKLDDLVLVGHASRVGANTMLCGQVAAGSTKVGAIAFCGQSASSGHLPR